MLIRCVDRDDQLEAITTEILSALNPFGSQPIGKKSPTGPTYLDEAVDSLPTLKILSTPPQPFPCCQNSWTAITTKLFFLPVTQKMFPSSCNSRLIRKPTRMYCWSELNLPSALWKAPLHRAEFRRPLMLPSRPFPFVPLWDATKHYPLSLVPPSLTERSASILFVQLSCCSCYLIMPDSNSSAFNCCATSHGLH